MSTSRRCYAAFAAALALVVAACGNDDSGSTPAPTAAPAATVSNTAVTAGADPTKIAIITSGPAADLGWNQGIISNARKLEEQGLITLTVVEQGYGVTAQDIVLVASDLAEDGNRVVIAHSFNYGEPLKTMVSKYPDVLFAYAGGFGDQVDNLADYDQPFYEPAFLAGILAGSLSESGILGVAGGFNIPVCHAMGAAFAEGAKLTYAGEVTLIESWIGSWGDVAKTKEATVAMAEQGADMFIPCGVEAGMIEGAKASNTTVIGYVMDQSPLAPENLLASVVWNLETVIKAMVDDVLSGAAPPAPYYEKGFTAGGTSLVLNEAYPRPIPAEALALFEEYEKKMRTGEFTVPFIPE
jgi:basic membrane protein A